MKKSKCCDIAPVQKTNPVELLALRDCLIEITGNSWEIYSGKSEIYSPAKVIVATETYFSIPAIIHEIVTRATQISINFLVFLCIMNAE